MTDSPSDGMMVSPLIKQERRRGTRFLVGGVDLTHLMPSSEHKVVESQELLGVVVRPFQADTERFSDRDALDDFLEQEALKTTLYDEPIQY